MIKKAARERQRIEQSKKGWWKDFNWCVGVMVEMEWSDEWWDAIVIKVLPAKANNVGNAENDPVLLGDPATVISHDSEVRPEVGMEVDDEKVAGKESGDMQDGASRKADEAENWEATLGYMVKKCQVTIINQLARDSEPRANGLTFNIYSLSSSLASLSLHPCS